MKKIFLFILSISFYFASCIYEPMTNYVFKIENHTNKNIIITYKTIKDSYEKSDTIEPEMKFEKDISKRNWFKDYKDSLIKKFFTKISIQCDLKEISKDPFNRMNWKEDKSKLERVFFNIGGQCEYDFEVNTNDLK